MLFRGLLALVAILIACSEICALNIEQIDHCMNNAGFRKAHLKLTVKPIECKVRPSFFNLEDLKLQEELKASSPVTTIPTHLAVPKCDGICANGKSCVPIERRTVMTPIMLKYSDDPIPKCVKIGIEEHVKCASRCMKSEKDCNELQNFVASQCTCQCKNSYESQYCTSRMKWDKDLCKCVCYMSEECSNGSTFDTKYCRCISDEEREDILPYDYYEQGNYLG